MTRALGLPDGCCDFCGQHHFASDSRCPPLPTLGENLIVEYRRAKRGILAGRRNMGSLTARERAGSWLTIGGIRRAEAIGRTCPSDVPTVQEALRLVRQAVRESAT